MSAVLQQGEQTSRPADTRLDGTDYFISSPNSHHSGILLDYYRQCLRRIGAYHVRPGVTRTDLSDGSILSFTTLAVPAVLLFGGTLYFALGTAYGWPGCFELHQIGSSIYLRSFGLFTLTFVWPLLWVISGDADLSTLAIYAGVMLNVMQQLENSMLGFGMWCTSSLTIATLATAVVLFLGGQAALFTASQPLCNVCPLKPL